MTIFDISLDISPSLPVWPGDPAIQLKQISFMDKGDVCNVSHLAMGVHAGTHVDAPHHFLNDGRTVENLDLEVLTGKAYLVQFADAKNAISEKILSEAGIPEGVVRLLIKTRNSKLWAMGEDEFSKEFVAISADGAEWLVRRGIKLVGVDYLSVAPFGEGLPTHKILLEAGIIALEGLNLSSVSQGYFELYCLPLKLMGSDGAPARAILKELL
jgi:arylformamidase